jgi:inorganic pyrophosphatase
MPGELEAIMVWFRDYKIPDGKPPSAFGFGDKPVGQPMAGAIIKDTHNAYAQLKEGVRANVGNLSLE